MKRIGEILAEMWSNGTLIEDTRLVKVSIEGKAIDDREELISSES